MNYAIGDAERVFRDCPPTMGHFQSKYQASCLGEKYKSWGCEKQVIIPGAFELDDFPFSPRPRDGFCVGKLARAAPTKWPVGLWKVLGEVKAKVPDTSALCMAWSGFLEQLLGHPPSWANCLRQDSISSLEFMDRCHALYCGMAETENDPRVGMESMARGVPVVADRKGGWGESIQDNVSGLLVDGPFESMNALRKLGEDDEFRMEIVHNARRSVEEKRNPEILGPLWKSALELLCT
jgi:hypothetical protein